MEGEGERLGLEERKRSDTSKRVAEAIRIYGQRQEGDAGNPRCEKANGASGPVRRSFFKHHQIRRVL